jgi:hypothetical protein
MLESPYERTVFLDADIYVAKPFPELFALLDRFDCAANQEEYLNTDWFNRYPRPDIPESFLNSTPVCWFTSVPQRWIRSCNAGANFTGITESKTQIYR